ncbi:hypothetical protein ACR71G_18735 [Xenorhabdus bovienii]
MSSIDGDGILYLKILLGFPQIQVLPVEAGMSYMAFLPHNSLLGLGKQLS